MRRPWQLLGSFCQLTTSPFPLKRTFHTKDGDGATRTRENTHHAHILAGEGILNGGEEQSRSAGDEGGLDGLANGVLGVVCVILLVVGHVVWYAVGDMEWRRSDSGDM